MKRSLLTIPLAVAVLLLTQIAAPAQRRVSASATYSAALSPQRGVSNPNMAQRRPGARVTYSAAFSIFNNIGVTDHYQVRWGHQEWQNYALSSGQGLTHYYPLGYNPNGLAPIPYVRFDRIADGDRYTEEV